MKMMMIAFACVIACVAMVGCSHNLGTAFNGRVFNVGYDPELNKFGVQYYNGLMVTGVGRENSEVNLEYNDDAAIQSGGTAIPMADAKATFKYSQKVGKQITGYYVDALKAGASREQLDEYTKEPPKANNSASDGNVNEDAITSAGQESGEPVKEELSLQAQ